MSSAASAIELVVEDDVQIEAYFALARRDHRDNPQKSILLVGYLLILEYVEPSMLRGYDGWFSNFVYLSSSDVYRSRNGS